MNKILYQEQEFPIFQNRMYETFEEAINCPKGDLDIVEDSKTGLVYNQAFNPKLMKYDINYQNEQALSPSFKQHLEFTSSIVEKFMGTNELVEVGCGKGFFLELLSEKGFDITGFDPAYEGKNQKIKKQYFKPSVYETSQGLILRHVLEHMQDPVEFLNQLKEANGGKGKIYIEVPCFDWICKQKAWFDIFYEHVNYFRLSDFHRMFDIIYDSGRSFGGQYLYIVADLSGLKVPNIDYEDLVKFPNNFREALRMNHNETDYAIWGGASKGVIFSLLLDRNSHPVKTVIDINPAKQNKFLPGTGLVVQSPLNALKTLKVGSIIYVMNSNYLEEIKEMSNNQYNYIGVDNVGL